MESLSRTSRTLRRSPGFVAIAALSLGAALGLSTSVFALIDAMTHPNSPFRDVDRLYSIGVYGKAPVMPSSKDVRDALAALPAVEGIETATWSWVDVEAGETVGNMSVSYVSVDFFKLMGVRPRIGRLPTPEENGSDGVAVVSDELWKMRFGNARETHNAHLSVGTHQYTIIGVLPPRANAPWDATSLWIPQREPTAGIFTNSSVIRLRNGVSEKDFSAQVKPVTERLTKTFATGANDRPFSYSLRNLRPDPLTLRDVHKAMIGAALCVLLIACANVAALMLARGTIRKRDYALRLALGATRRDIEREVIFEVAALAIVGSVAGAIVATWAVGVMKRATPGEMSFMGFVEPQWSVRVLALSAIAVIAAVGVSGAIPAWQASRTDPAGTLKESSGGTTGRAGTRFRWLIMAELAISMTLLVGASLMLKSAVLMSRYDFGLDASRLSNITVSVYGRLPVRTTAELSTIYRGALTRVRAVLGVESAAMIALCPGLWTVVTTDRSIEGSKPATLPQCTNVSTDYFRSVSRTIAEGRDFADGDAQGDGVVILDEKTAHRLFPHESAVGRMIKLGNLRAASPWMSVVGVVKNKDMNFNMNPELGPDSADVMFMSARDSSRQLHKFVVKSIQGAVGTRVAVGRAMRDFLPKPSSVTVVPWANDFNVAVGEERFLTLVFSLLGAASLALGAAGLFSVVSYIASQRMREFAVRIALGATRENVVTLVLRDALAMALGGTAIGAGFGMWAGFMLWDKMYGVYPVDVAALVGAEATLLVVTMLACLVPALRAMKANPVDVMRAT